MAATSETPEEGSGCAASTEHSVWYSLRAAGKERIALNLAAAGALDATIDVFHAVRSELQRVGCERTDSHGLASLSFAASKNGLYEIRVAALPGSQLAGFTLEAFLPTPAVVRPGRGSRRRRRGPGRPDPEHQRGLLGRAALRRQLPGEPGEQDRPVVA